MAKKPAPKEDYYSLRNWIGDLESGNRYDVLHGGDTADLTGMTIGEVKELQRERIANGDQSAAGKYQIINRTLEDLQRRKPSWFKDDRLFDEETQDLMADVLIDDRVKRAKKSDGDLTDNLVNELAKEWAGLPTLAGVSNYEGIAGNKALTTVEDARSVVGDFVNKATPKLEEVKVTAKKKGPPLDEVEVTAERRPELKPQDIKPPKLVTGDPKFDLPPLEEITVEAQKRNVPIGLLIRDIVVNAKKKNIDPSDWLKEIQVTAQKKKNVRPPPSDLVMGNPDFEYPPLEQAEVTAKRRPTPTINPPLEPIEVTAQRRKGVRPPPPDLIMGDPSFDLPPLEPVEVTATKREGIELPPLEPVEVTAQRRKGIRPPPPELIMGDPSIGDPPLNEVEVTAERRSEPDLPEVKTPPSYDDFMPTQEDLAERLPSPTIKVTDDSSKYDEFMPTDSEAIAMSNRREQERDKQFLGGLRNIAQGATFALADEAEAGVRSLLGDRSYSEILGEVRNEMDEYRTENPGSALYQELVPGIVTGTALARQGAKFGMSNMATGGIEGIAYGAGSGRTAEERAAMAALGGTVGTVVGRIFDPSVASRPGAKTATNRIDPDMIEQKVEPGATLLYRTTKGDLRPVRVLDVLKNGKVQIQLVNGRKSQFAVGQDALETVDATGFNHKVAQQSEEAYEQAQKLREVRQYEARQEQKVKSQGYAEETITRDDPNSNYNRFFSDLRADRPLDNVEDSIVGAQRLRDATNVGEVWQGLKTSFKGIYNEWLRGVSDTIMAEVSPKLGALFQRIDETWLRTINKEMDDTGLIERLAPVIQRMETDKEIKGIYLDFSANFLSKGLKGQEGYATSLSELRRLMAGKLDEEQINTLMEYIAWSGQKNRRNMTVVSGAEYDPYVTYGATRLNKAAAKKMAEQKKKNIHPEELEDEDDWWKALPADSGLKRRSRGSYLYNNVNQRRKASRPNPDDYENPLLTDIQRTFNLEKLYQISRMTGFKPTNLKKNKQGQLVPMTPEEFMKAWQDDLVRRGIPADRAEYAIELITQNITGATRTPHPLLQALNSFTYLTTLAGPMSAILNLADVPLAAAKFGSKEMLDDAITKSPLDLKRMGLDNQTYGEFVNRINESLALDRGKMHKFSSDMRNLTDIAMKGSLFAAFDRIGKRGVMDTAWNSAVKLAKEDKLADMWGFYFTPQELSTIKKGLLKHGKDFDAYTPEQADLIEQLLVAGLGQQQLISSAGRPAAWARHPNLRGLWALRGFVIKQQALALREVVDNLRRGEVDKAVGFLKRYALWGAGGYAVINEGRQFMFGDGNASIGGMVRGYGDAWASLLTMNTIGLNDYQWGKIQEEGILTTGLKATIPTQLDRLYDVTERSLGALTGSRYLREPVIDALPFVKQSLRGVRNASGVAGFETPEQITERLLERKPRER